MQFDLIIRNGQIIDGTGAPRYAGDIGIRDGKIAKTGVVRGSAKKEIDAEGRIVAPGYVETHCHFDGLVYWDPTCSNLGENGVTTAVIANCGHGFAPVAPENRERAMQMMETSEQIAAEQLRQVLPWDWETVPEFLDSLRRTPKSVNLLSYVPTNQVFIYVMGLEESRKRRPTKAELTRMKEIINEAMDAGAIGFSMSHLGKMNNHVDIDGSMMPTDYAHIDDLCELASLLKERGDGVIHILSSLGPAGDRENTLKIARASRRPVIHNSILCNKTDPDLHRESIRWVERARKDEGLEIFATVISLRAWSEADFWDTPGSSRDMWPLHRRLTIETKTLEGRMALARDEDYRAEWRDFYKTITRRPAMSLEDLTIISMGEAETASECVGKTVEEIAFGRGTPISDTYLDLAIESEFAMQMKTPYFTSSNPVQLAEMIAPCFAIPGASDGAAHNKSYSGGQYGTDLILNLCRENSLVSLEQLHFQLSYVCARAVGLKDRGALLEGMAADIIIYDLDELYFDMSAYEKVYDMPGGDWRKKARSGGYRYILVNGEVTFVNDEFVGTHPGDFLRTTEDFGHQLQMIAAE